ncbi:NADPH2:quinone reductase [Solimonas aquatica]|uniref:NADPH2:quinone reductase n=1 Tax=Solimonas aquatica TaxID=489703 RepID=A0A1H8ZNY8_9GAMM|nr:NAD(P)H-quinone oxidoreductase [Solimonas aquatica]SEP65943.1 NADPH2:quinone reductase [Solimonas aquatica]
MRAVEILRQDQDGVLSPCERPKPEPKAGEVLLRVRAAGINRPDVLQRKGLYPVPPGVTDIPGLEVAGEIVAGDLEDSGLKIGDKVCALLQGGGYAEYCTAATALCLPYPQGLSDVEAASLPETFFTVWSNLFDRGELAPGESVLVQGGSSGIGVAAIQLAHARGHRVFATAGTAEKVRACEALGAERGINYRSEDFAAVIREATGGRGVDVILDMVGGAYVPRELSCLADDGRLVFIALLGGAQAEIGLGPILLRRLTVTGSTLRPRAVAFKARIAQALQREVWPLLAAGRIKPVIYKTFALEQAGEAQQLMESSQHIGKIVLTP